MKRLFLSLSRTNDGAFIIDGRHRIIFWNQAAEKILGFPADEVIGRPCYEILGGRDEQGNTLCQLYCRVAIQVERGDILPNRDIYARTLTNGNRWLNVTTFAYPVADKTIGEVIVHIFRDTTELKSYQQFVNQVLSASEQFQQEKTHQVISSTRVRSPVKGLTTREWQILELMAQGLGTNEIAKELTISTSTVRNHVQNVLEKLGVHSRLEAIAYAYQRGIMKSI